MDNKVQKMFVINMFLNGISKDKLLGKVLGVNNEV